jgi:hypothetical protein
MTRGIEFMSDQRLMTVESRNGLYVAQFITSPAPYEEGAIRVPAEYDNDAARMELAQAVVDSLVPVVPEEKEYTNCTDGRLPVDLEDGSPVPPREQLVGADILTALFMADALGARFYANPLAPVKERIDEVIDFLTKASTHVPCGAGDGFPAVSQNVVRYSNDSTFVERNGLFVPGFDQKLYQRMIGDLAKRQQKGLYDGYDPRMIDAAVRAKTGGHAIARLRDDGRGVHGHVEEQKLRIQVRNVALDVPHLAEVTGGRQVFALSDTRLDELAQKFGRGNDADYLMARMAGEAWTNAGWGTLSKDLPTLVVTAR